MKMLENEQLIERSVYRLFYCHICERIRLDGKHAEKYHARHAP